MKFYGVTLQMKPIWQSLRIALFGFQYFMDVKLSFFESFLVQSYTGLLIMSLPWARV